MRILRCAVLALAVLLAPSYAEKPKSDGELRDQVMIKLAGDPDAKGANLTVDAQDGVITLKGRLENEKQRSRAEKVAKKVKGVKAVKNEISVGPR